MDVYNSSGGGESFLEEDHEEWTHQWSVILLLRAGSDTLPTPMNLHRMRIQHSSKCPLCSSMRFTHILKGCFTALHQGRYTRRHDSVLANISQGIQSLLPDSTTLYADLDGMRTENNPPSTNPPNILSTAMQPDIVIIDLSKNVWMLELTVPTNTPAGLSQARTRKQNKPVYSNHVTDFKSLGWKVNYNTVKIGSLGHFFLSQLIESPTHIKGNILDLLMTNHNDSIKILTILPHDQSSNIIPSDHCLITFDTRLYTDRRFTSSTSSCALVFDFPKADLDGLCSYLLDHHFSSCIQSNHVNTVWLRIKEAIMTGMNLFVPKVRLRRNQQPKCFTSHIRHRLNCTKTLRKECKNHPTSSKLSKLSSS